MEKKDLLETTAEIVRRSGSETGGEFAADASTVEAILKAVMKKAPDPETVASWGEEDRRLAGEWGAAVYLWANDQDVRIPPLPKALEAYRRLY